VEVSAVVWALALNAAQAAAPIISNVLLGVIKNEPISKLYNCGRCKLNS
jgi:hypothetical protein